MTLELRERQRTEVGEVKRVPWIYMQRPWGKGMCSVRITQKSEPWLKHRVQMRRDVVEKAGF